MRTKSKTPASDTNGYGFGSTSSATSDGAFSRLSGEFRHFLTDIEDLIKKTTSLTGDELTEAKEKLSARVATAKESVEVKGSGIADRARHTVKITDGYVHERPWRIIGIGAGLGLLIGLAVAHRG